MQFRQSINFSIIHEHTMCNSHDTQRVYDASNGVFIGLESFCAKASIGQARHMLEFTGYGQLVCSELGFTVYSTMDMLYIIHFSPPPPHTHTLSCQQVCSCHMGWASMHQRIPTYSQPLSHTPFIVALHSLTHTHTHTHTHTDTPHTHTAD